MNRLNKLSYAAAIGAWAIGSVGSASAATVTNIASTITNTGSVSAESYSTVSQGGTTQVENVPPTQSFSFGDSFNQTGNVSSAADFGAGVGSQAGGPWNFQDNILFTTNGALVQAQAIAQLSNVTNLQARIISLSDPNNPPSLFDVTASANAAHLVGNSSVTTVQSGWTNFTVPALGVDLTATMANVVSPGAYILQIRGEAAAGSSYSGTISFTPVPLPAALPLLLTGLGLFGGAARRRLQTA